jgi:Resolvase, N terminal domain
MEKESPSYITWALPPFQLNDDNLAVVACYIEDQMLLQLSNNDPACFFNQISECERPISDAERLQLLVELYTKPASSYRSPGALQLGRQRMRAVGYFRNSVGKLDVSTSIPRQLEKFLNYCARMNLIPAAVFADPDTSGVTVLQRPGLMRMLLQVRAGLIDVITAEAPVRTENLTTGVVVMKSAQHGT